MDPTTTSPTRWTYTEISIHDGDRILKPTHICSTEITFRDPPELQCTQITVHIQNGNRKTVHTARVLPHESGAIRIPIQLASANQNAPAKLIA